MRFSLVLSLHVALEHLCIPYELSEHVKGKQQYRERERLELEQRKKIQDRIRVAARADSWKRWEDRIWSEVHLIPDQIKVTQDVGS